MRTTRLGLADDLFLLAHREYSGRTRINRQSLEVALAGALLGELILAKKIAVEVHARVLVVQDLRPPDCPLQHELLDLIVRTPELSAIRSCLDYVHLIAYEKVAARLLKGNIIHKELAGPPWGRTAVYPVNDVNTTGHIPTRITNTAQRGGFPDIQDALLLGVGYAGNFANLMLQDHRNTDGYITSTLRQLPPAFRCLMAEIRAAIGSIAVNRPR